MSAFGWFVAGWAASKFLGSDNKNETEDWFERIKKQEAEKRAQDRIRELENRLKRLENGYGDDYRHQDLRGW